MLNPCGYEDPEIFLPSLKGGKHSIFIIISLVFWVYDNQLEMHAKTLINTFYAFNVPVFV